jgi:hypothetical protein
MGAQFDNLAGQVTALFNQIQALPLITQVEAEQAVNAYQQLAQIAAQYPTEYITRQWNSQFYKPAYESRLRQIVARVAQDSAPAGGPLSPVTGLPAPASSFSSLLSQSWLPWVALGLVGVAVLRRRTE